jgi:hypothetical protein
MNERYPSQPISKKSRGRLSGRMRMAMIPSGMGAYRENAQGKLLESINLPEINAQVY